MIDYCGVCRRESPGKTERNRQMAVTVRTKNEAEWAGFDLPAWAAPLPSDFLFGHDDDDGSLLVWGPGYEHHDVNRLARAYD